MSERKSPPTPVSSAATCTDCGPGRRLLCRRTASDSVPAASSFSLLQWWSSWTLLGEAGELATSICCMVANVKRCADTTEARVHAAATANYCKIAFCSILGLLHVLCNHLVPSDRLAAADECNSREGLAPAGARCARRPESGGPQPRGRFGSHPCSEVGDWDGCCRPPSRVRVGLVGRSSVQRLSHRRLHHS